MAGWIGDGYSVEAGCAALSHQFHIVLAASEGREMEK